MSGWTIARNRSRPIAMISCTNENHVRVSDTGSGVFKREWVSRSAVFASSSSAPLRSSYRSPASCFKSSPFLNNWTCLESVSTRFRSSNELPS